MFLNNSYAFVLFLCFLLFWLELALISHKGKIVVSARNLLCDCSALQVSLKYHHMEKQICRMYQDVLKESESFRINWSY